MANIRSAIKRNRQNQKRRAHNRVLRGGTRTAMKKARTAIENNDANAVEVVNDAARILDKAASKGIIHPNNAARRKSRLMKALNKSISE